MKPIKVGITGVTGYAGAELARLLCRHPGVELASVAARSALGQPLAQVFPHLADVQLTIEAELGEVELAFSALPHKASAEAVLPLLERGVKVIDLSADFRLKDEKEYERWYGVAHPAPGLLKEAVYGLPELHRSRIASARLVANPGCYPTSAILALAPLVKAGLVQPDIIIDSKSGVSGAGRTLSLTSHFSEVNENLFAYALEGHRHFPEIVQGLAALNPGFMPSASFVPHLVPMTRGILSTCYAWPVKGELPHPSEGESKGGELRKVYREFYRSEPFVRVVDSPPRTKQAWGSNLCLIYPTIDPRTGRIIIISCLDNLVKGGAGQAIQNMNLMLGLPEGMGLEGLAIYP